jgi:hypothetical protein
MSGALLKRVIIILQWAIVFLEMLICYGLQNNLEFVRTSFGAKKGIKKYTGIIPVLAIALALGIELALGLRGQYVFNPAYLVLGLNIIFVGMALAVAYLSAKSFLLTGSLSLLFIALSFVLICVAAVMNGLLVTLSPNWGVTVFAVGFLVFAVLQFASAYQASFRSVPFGSEHRKARLFLVCLAAVSMVTVISLLTVLNIFPPFFINGTGVTLTDQIILSIIVIFFFVTSVLFLRQYVKTRSNVLFWYTLGLVLDMIGAYGLSLQLQFSDIVVWTGRIGVYLAAVYYLIALLSSKEGIEA